MISLSNIVIAAVATAAVGYSTESEARRAQREGVNFGVSVRAGSETWEAPANDGSDAKVEVSSTAASPFVGYSFGTINIGVMAVNESTKYVETRPLEDGSNSVETRSGNLGGAGVFSRLLFGRFFFFELGAGIYKGSLSSSSEIARDDGAGYSGDRTSSSLSGTGYGIHYGGGLEIPIADGFHMSAAYIAREVRLSGFEKETKASLSRERGELSFGLIHYLQ